MKPLVADIDFATLLADKALAAIPSKADRKPLIPHDSEMYEWRHLTENCFQHLKEFRRIVTPYDQTDTNFAAALHLVAAFLTLR